MNINDEERRPRDAKYKSSDEQANRKLQRKKLAAGLKQRPTAENVIKDDSTPGIAVYNRANKRMTAEPEDN